MEEDCDNLLFYGIRLDARFFVGAKRGLYE